MKQHYLLLSITVSSMAIFKCYSPVQKYARSYNRNQFEMRPVKITDNSFGCADASVLFEIGNTKVLCTISLAAGGAPDRYKNKNMWWLAATYTLLPHATYERNPLCSSVSGNERSIEIARFIGRALRSSLQLPNTTQPKTVHVDCTVLQADGGTRTACITAGSIALQLAQKKWLAQGYIKKPIVSESIAALSAGMVNGQLLVDLDYQEDSSAASDFNVVLTKTGKIIAIQGGAEKEPIVLHSVIDIYKEINQSLIPLFIYIEQIVKQRRFV